MNENKPRRRANAARTAQKSAYRKSGLSRIVLMVTMMALVAVVSIGGTLAWLQAETDEVVNTFTTADIGLTLEETPNKDDKWEAQLIPGVSYTKDPVVTITNDVEAYLFVEFNPNDSAKYLEYTSTLTTEAGWTKLSGDGVKPEVWYRIVGTTEQETREWHLLDGDTVKVREDLQKKGSDTLPMPENGFTMTYQAYAIQTANGRDADGEITKFTPDEAWAKVKPATENP